MESTCSTCKYKIVVFQLFDYLSLILRLPSGVLFLLKVLLLLLISTMLNGGRPVLPHSDIVYTNSELYDLLDPARDDLPFVYDNFRMHHCEVLNYDMTGTE